MARILLLNPAPREGVAFVREARCSIRESLKGTPFPCLTLARLAACLRSKGHEICLVDASAERLSVSDVINRVERRGAPPDLIIFATATPTIKSDCLGVGQLRRHWGANTLTFGAHCSGLREQVLREHAEIDALLVGEPEDPVVELCGRMDAMGFDVAVPNSTG